MKKIISLALALSIGATLPALASAFWGGTIINIAPTDTLKIRKWPSASSQIIDAYAVGQAGVFFRVIRAVGMFPSVAQIHVVTHGHHDAAFIVVNGFPIRFVAVVFGGFVERIVDDARNLELVVKIV